MNQSKIVVRYQDGRVKKGFTNDFMPNKDRFHLVPIDAPPAAHPIAVYVRELKAVFFVKDFTGDPQYQDKNTFDPSRPVPGRKIQVVFKDQETLIGMTHGYDPGRPGFFVVPSDPDSNIDRCFVISAATQAVSFI
jgi:hypothetical protein